MPNQSNQHPDTDLVQTTFKLPRWLLDRLRLHAKAHHRSLSEELRQAASVQHTGSTLSYLCAPQAGEVFGLTADEVDRARAMAEARYEAVRAEAYQQPPPPDPALACLAEHEPVSLN